MSGTFVGPGGTLGTVPVLQVDGRTYTDLSTLIRLYAHFDASNNNCAARLSSGSAGYTVTALKTLTISSIRMTWNQAFTNVANNSCSIGYCDNDVGYGTNTVPTNPIYIFGINPQSNVSAGLMGLGSPVDLIRELSLDFAIPAGKFILIQQASAVTNINFELFGYEA